MKFCGKLGTWFVAAALGLGACGDSDGASDDGGLDAAPVTMGTDGGGDSGMTPPITTGGVMCGTNTCVPSAGQSMLGGTSCCFGDAMDECGLMTALIPGSCMELGRPGGIDTSCPSYDVMNLGFLVWPGCCTPAGTCGALDSSMDGLGCIPNDEIGQPAQTCTYDPNNTCTGLLPVECDGPEDCTGGQFCCGELMGGGAGVAYTGVACSDNCAIDGTPTDAGVIPDGGASNALYSEICHDGQACQVDGFTCSSNTDYLPDFLARCRDTMTQAAPASWDTTPGELNCGDTVCRSGEKCCVSLPTGDPYCADASDDCKCNASGNQGNDDGGADDGG